MNTERLAKCTAAAFIVLLLNTSYVAAFAFPTIFYMSNVLLHLALGAAVAVAFAILLKRSVHVRRGAAVAAAFFLASILFAGYLVAAGNVRAHRWALWGHII